MLHTFNGYVVYIYFCVASCALPLSIFSSVNLMVALEEKKSRVTFYDFYSKASSCPPPLQKYGHRQIQNDPFMMLP